MPCPKVDSAVITIDVLDEPRVSVKDNKITCNFYTQINVSGFIEKA